jgi:hypothetical protein
MIIVPPIDIATRRREVQTALKAAAVSLSVSWVIFEAATHATMKTMKTRTYIETTKHIKSTVKTEIHQNLTKETNQAYVISRFGFLMMQHICLLKHSVKSRKFGKEEAN